jgi:hypothetical protein
MLRYDGFCKSRVLDFEYYLRFYADGTVTGTSEYAKSAPSNSVKIFEWLDKSEAHISKGEYHLQEFRIWFNLHSDSGLVGYEGNVIGDNLELSWYSSINNIEDTEVYSFVQV